MQLEFLRLIKFCFYFKWNSLSLLVSVDKNPFISFSKKSLLVLHKYIDLRLLDELISTLGTNWSFWKSCLIFFKNGNLVVVLCITRNKNFWKTILFKKNHFSFCTTFFKILFKKCFEREFLIKPYFRLNTNYFILKKG